MLAEGRFSDAIEACRKVWASLPGGDSGQPQVALAKLISFYGDKGGQFA